MKENTLSKGEYPWESIREDHVVKMKCDEKSKIKKWARGIERYNFVKIVGNKFGVNN